MKKLITIAVVAVTVFGLAYMISNSVNSKSTSALACGGANGGSMCD